MVLFLYLIQDIAEKVVLRKAQNTLSQKVPSDY